MSGALFTSPEILSGVITNTPMGESDILSKAITDPSSLFHGEQLLYMFIGFGIFLWILTILRVAKDCVARTRSILGQIISIIIATIGGPLIGLPLYIACRPAQYKKDITARKEALDLQTTTCPTCKMVNRAEYSFCLLCGNTLHTTCLSCNNKHPYDYPHCPYCGDEQKIEKKKSKKKGKMTEKVEA